MITEPIVCLGNGPSLVMPVEALDRAGATLDDSVAAVLALGDGI